MLNNFLWVVTILLTAGSASAQTVIYVDDDAPLGGDGMSWVSAYKYLQDGLAEVRNRDEIHVAGGLYKPDLDEGGNVIAGDRNAAFAMINGTAVFGGYRGCPLGDCIGSDPNHRDILVYETILSGDLSGDDSLHFANNIENSYHVVVSIGRNLSAILDGFTITRGNANGDQMPSNCGGGMYNDGGIPFVTNCMFVNNFASLGGGMCNVESNPNVTNCRFSGNTSNSGGGIYNDASLPIIVNCTFNGNLAEIGASVYDDGISNSTIINNIFWKNGNPANSPVFSSLAIVTHSCVQGGYSGNGNIDIDPLFVADGFWNDSGTPDVPEDDTWISGDYHLQAESPCINAGDNGSVPIDILIDFEGDVRIQDCGVDMGVDETPYSGFDCNINGISDGCDLAQGTSADCNYNGVPDDCEPDEDCNLSGTRDICDIGNDISSDCDGNLVPDECEPDEDCNMNGITDICDIGNDVSKDCNRNRIPDECEPDQDCNTNGITDICDIADGTSLDCNNNIVPDECEPNEDCNTNGVTDICDIANGTSRDCNGNRVPDECDGPFVYVDDNATDGANNGVSWSDAYTDLQDALGVVLACRNLFTEIRIAQGTYNPGVTRDAAFRMVNDITLAGGYRGIDPASPGDPNDRDIGMFKTILSGDLNGDDGPGFENYSDNSVHVFFHPDGLRLNETAILEGVVITSGNAIDNNPIFRDGAGMYNQNNSPTIKNCTFIANIAQSGGAVYNRDNSPVFLNCNFIGNTSLTAGGGIYNIYSTPTITNCTFVANAGVPFGGAMDFVFGGGALVTNCIFWGNRPSDRTPISSPIGITTLVTYSCVEHGYVGEGNIDTDPLFIDNGSWDDHGTPDDLSDDFWIPGNIHLQVDSPCINTGINDAVPVGIFDIDSEDRIQQCRIDMGADETPYSLDCNNNDVGDECDIALGTSGDCNHNDMPDDCEPDLDCNKNGIQDICDIAGITSEDCNENGIPDDCEPGGLYDCDGDGKSDLCEIYLNTTRDCNANLRADACDGPVIYVDDDATSGANNGESWTDAYTNLQDAIAEAVTCGSVFKKIKVAHGTYRPGESRTDSFRLINFVTIEGGYRGININNPGDPDDRDIALYETILSCDLDGDDITDLDGLHPCFSRDGNPYPTGCDAYDEDGDGDVDFRDAHLGDNCAHVINNTSEMELERVAMLDGFTITGGNSIEDASSSGGGMRNRQAWPRLENCTFIGNWATSGGGMFNYSNYAAGSPTLSKCIFSHNWSVVGGGMSNWYSSPSLSRCTFIKNWAVQDGGGIQNRIESSPWVRDTIFSENHAGWHGGGMYSYYSSSPIVIRCTFTNNFGKSGGGGMYNTVFCRAHVDYCTFSYNSSDSLGGAIYNISSSAQIVGSIFYGNSGRLGGAIYSRYDTPKVFNCLFSGNLAIILGGAMYNQECQMKVSNCTFSGNRAQKGGGIYNFSSNATIANSIITGNTSFENEQIFNLNSTPVITYSNIEGGYIGVGNIDIDPRFVNEGHWDDNGTPDLTNDDTWIQGDYHLSADSLCINRGDNDSIIGPIFGDIDIEDRIQLCRVDMGADESSYYRDCNMNELIDACELVEGSSFDCNNNRFPDECDPDFDCNTNGIQDICDVAAGTSADCNGNEIPDECEGPVIYVDDSAGSGRKTGATWADARLDLQDALDDVRACGSIFSEIRVAQGTYFPGTKREVSFQLINDVTLSGGYRGVDAGNPGDPDERNIQLFETILSGDLDDNDENDVFNRIDNSLHIFNHPVELGLNGSAILDGFTITAGNANRSAPDNLGGGMYNNGCSPTVTHCKFNWNGSNDGAAIYNKDSHMALLNCLITGNHAHNNGGGVYNNNSSTVITNCTFNGNVAELGGAIFNNLTGFSIVTNSIIWGNNQTQKKQVCEEDTNTFTNITFSCVEDGSPGKGNIDVDPRVVQLGHWDDNGTLTTNDDIWNIGDYHLQADSPCLDVGSNEAIPVFIITDYEGEERVQQCRVDMGVDEAPYFQDCNGNDMGDACEIQQEISGDCNNNGVPDECDPAADCNKNGVQDVCDIGEGTSTDCNINDIPDECEGPILYVDNVATGANDGTSWVNAYTDLQIALQEAAACSQLFSEVRIAQGTYKPCTTRTVSFQLANGVIVAGGYRGVDPSKPGDPDDRDIQQFVTILSGDLFGNDGPGKDTLSDNSYNIFYHPESLSLDHTAVLDGVTITGGAAINSSPYYGGGMYNHSCSPTISNCIFRGCSAFNGAGIYNLTSEPKISHCIFSNNNAGIGGGIYNDNSNPVIEDCDFISNVVGAGGGIANRRSHPNIVRCTFNNNNSTRQYFGGGGGIYNGTFSSPIVTDCIFTENFALTGGGIYNEDSSPQIIRCVFDRNHSIDAAYGGGGGLYNSFTSNLLIIDSVFIENTSDAHGGGMITYADQITMIGCTFRGNSARESGGAIYTIRSLMKITNGLFIGNRAGGSGGAILLGGSDITIVNSTFSRNVADYLGGGIFYRFGTATVTNCILWENRDRIGNGESSQINLEIFEDEWFPSYSCIQGLDSFAGNGNTGKNPLFVDISGIDGIVGTQDDDLHLLPGSPCVDAGDNREIPIDEFDLDNDGDMSEPLPIDLNNNPRFIDDPCVEDSGELDPMFSDFGMIDMGAYERSDDSTEDPDNDGLINCDDNCPARFNPVQADCDGDGVGDVCILSFCDGSTSCGDCNDNGIPDSCDISNGDEVDVDGNGRPDVCQHVWFVEDDAPLGGDGSQWSTAFKYLQDALFVAQLGDEIRVARGTYYPDIDESGNVVYGSREATFRLVNGVTMYGGYLGCPGGDCLQANPDTRNFTSFASILSGYVAFDDPENISRCYNVVNATGTDSSTIFDGFTIAGGYANADMGYNIAQGAGMTIFMGSPTIANCTFTNNVSEFSGAGMYMFKGNAIIRNCSFYNNRAGENGGGMLNVSSAPTLIDCSFSQNKGRDGGGVYNSFSHPSIINTTFTENSARFNGGGMFNSGGQPTLTDCVFRKNLVESNFYAYGGGIYNSSSDTTLNTCSFIGNIAQGGYDSYGGGVINRGNSNMMMTNCEFSENTANIGGAINNSSSLTLTNCSLDQNAAVFGGGIYQFFGSPTITSCVFYGNRATNSGGAMYYLNPSTSALTNSTFVANIAPNGEIVGYDPANLTNLANLTFYQCILRSDGDFWSTNDNLMTITYSHIQDDTPNDGIVYPGTGNIDIDPLFLRHPNDGGDGWGDNLDTPDMDEGANDDFGDLRLSSGSPCINAGDPTFTVEPGVTDIVGHDRILCDLVDMGAHEFGIGDTDCDLIVDLNDFTYWSDCFTGPGGGPLLPTCEVFDVEGDGDVDLKDYATFMAYFMP